MFEVELKEIKAAGMYKVTKVIAGRQGAEVKIDGKKFLNFCANNYLGLAGSDEMVRVAQEGLEK